MRELLWAHGGYAGTFVGSRGGVAGTIVGLEGGMPKLLWA